VAEDRGRVLAYYRDFSMTGATDRWRASAGRRDQASETHTGERRRRTMRWRMSGWLMSGCLRAAVRTPRLCQPVHCHPASPAAQRRREREVLQVGRRRGGTPPAAGGSKRAAEPVPARSRVASPTCRPGARRRTGGPGLGRLLASVEQDLLSVHGPRYPRDRRRQRQYSPRSRVVDVVGRSEIVPPAPEAGVCRLTASP
jgi:hypothetical protein